MEIGTAQ